MIRIVACALLAASMVPRIGAAQSLGMITILEGNASVIRGAASLVAIEGMRVEATDLIHTGDANVVQLELVDKSVAQFGPNTRAMLTAAGASKSRNSRSTC